MTLRELTQDRINLLKKHGLKRETIRFYTGSGLYKGWLYATAENIVNAQNWVRSGNTVHISNCHTSDNDKITSLEMLRRAMFRLYGTCIFISGN